MRVPSFIAASLTVCLTAGGPAHAQSKAQMKPNANDEFVEQDAEADAQNADEGNAKASVKAGPRDTPAQAREAERLQTAGAGTVRRFHEVLDELLAEFGYDVKMGQIKGLSNVAVRQVKVSKAIPRTYEDYVETLLVERMRENSQVRMISCIPCKTRTSSLVDGKLMITSPATNLGRLESAAEMLGIASFMDAVLVYHTTHMVLALTVFDTKTKELQWARTYNSETIKTRYQKLAVDYSQVAKARPGEDYVPEYRFLFGIGGAALPNVGGGPEDSTMMNVQVRASEKFNNRRTEFGILLSLLKPTSSVFKEYPSDKPVTTKGEAATEPRTEERVTQITPKPFKQAAAIYATYGHVFLGAVESYNEVRHGFHVGVGGIAASGYLAPIARTGWDVFLGRRFTASAAGGYVLPATILVDGESLKTKGGAGGDLILSLNY